IALNTGRRVFRHAVRLIGSRIDLLTNRLHEVDPRIILTDWRVSQAVEDRIIVGAAKGRAHLARNFLHRCLLIFRRKRAEAVIDADAPTVDVEDCHDSTRRKKDSRMWWGREGQM